MVDDVKDLPTKLQVQALRKLSHLNDVCIPLFKTGAAKTVPTAGSELPVGRFPESRSDIGYECELGKVVLRRMPGNPRVKRLGPVRNGPKSARLASRDDP